STPPQGKLALPKLAEMKRRGEKIVMVTAYDAPGARFAEDSGIDIVLVGDTAAMVVLGYDGTVPVTMDEMVFLTRTVARAARRPRRHSGWSTTRSRLKRPAASRSCSRLCRRPSRPK